MNHFRSPLNCSLRVIGLAVLSSLSAAAFAAPPPANDVQITELPDGSLVTSVKGTGVVVHAHYTHQAKLVASNCLSLEARRVGLHDLEPELVNNCAYATAFSYCVDNADVDTEACDSVGHRKAESYRIEARATFPIRNVAAGPDTYVGWVACHADVTAISTLIANGTRGECLGNDGSAQTASIESGDMSD